MRSSHHTIVPRDDVASDAVSSPTEYLKRVIDQLQTPYPDNRIINIVCHGHSVPAGYFQTPEVRSFDSYPHLLHVALKKQFPFAILNVIVTAIGGEDSERGAARFDQDVMCFRPDVVTIDYALNDRQIGLERAEAAWRRMIEMATAGGAPVMLLTPTPDMDANTWDPRDPLNHHASQVRALAQRYRVGLADSQAVFQTYCRNGGRLEELMSHARHPNRTGHGLIANGLLTNFVATLD